LDHSPCECGRTSVRMARIIGRSDDMLIIRGVNVFPSQIESVLLEVPEASPNYVIIVDRKGTLDTIEIQVELNPEYMTDSVTEMEAIRRKIKQKLDNVLRIGVILTLAEHKTIARSQGKAKRVIDNRKY
ncbi:MAG: phenylacetate--CoA ligase, partial [Firmicutes bacterium]|nr:phenylacetate--CoA ligase [Bacillota bacterium]